MSLKWEPAADIGVISGPYQVYECRPGSWRALFTRTDSSVDSLCRGRTVTTEEEAKRLCDNHAWRRKYKVHVRQHAQAKARRTGQ